MTELTDICNLLIDMDGVLYRGETPLPGSRELVEFLEEVGIDYLLVTNNSTSTPAEFVARLEGMGIHAREESIVTSGIATANYLRTRAPSQAKVNVVGEEALIEELQKRGFVMAGRDADYVVCGWDRGINFEKLKIACLAIRDGAIFVGTNPDKTYPLEDDIIPGAGSILAALIAATDVEPIVVGKPEPIMFEQALDLLDAEPAKTAILGDRLETDILGGYRAGIATAMVLTGISTEQEAKEHDVAVDFIFEDLPTLVQAWKKALDNHTSAS